MPTDTEANWSDINGRLHNLPKAVDGYIETLRLGIEKGIVPDIHIEVDPRDQKVVDAALPGTIQAGDFIRIEPELQRCLGAVMVVNTVHLEPGMEHHQPVAFDKHLPPKYLRPLARGEPVVLDGLHHAHRQALTCHAHCGRYHRAEPWLFVRSDSRSRNGLSAPKRTMRR